MHRLNRTPSQLSDVNRKRESGNAIVEFVGIIIVIIGPALILLMGLGAVLGAQFGVEAAARDSVRELVRCSGNDCQEQAELQARAIWESRGHKENIDVVVSCSAFPCHSPGTTISITVGTRIEIPSMGYEVPVSASYSMTVDSFRSSHE